MTDTPLPDPEALLADPSSLDVTRYSQEQTTQIAQSVVTAIGDTPDVERWRTAGRILGVIAGVNTEREVFDAGQVWVRHKPGDVLPSPDVTRALTPLVHRHVPGFPTPGT